MRVHGSVGLQYASVDEAKERGLAGGFRGLLNNIRVGLMEDRVEDGSAIESLHVSVEALEAIVADGRCQGTPQHDNVELLWFLRRSRLMAPLSPRMHCFQMHMGAD